ncbi:glutamate synthase-related protein [Spirosoma sp. SC4-14]|uniref:glutamate synthase-related protein n=1 Tax=Spirosoma sp. SC4-14 TaxID=3128900 RepID=UPI0030CC5852
MNSLPPVVDLISIARFDELPNRQPTYAKVNTIDLVLIRYEEEVSILYGRCLHRGALLADGTVEGNNLICGLHRWDYRIDTGISEYNNAEALHKFTTYIRDGHVLVDRTEIRAYEQAHPQPFKSETYLGDFSDTHPESTEPYTTYIKHLAQHGLTLYGHHGAVAAMGVDRNTLPKWEDIQLLPAQLSRKPLLDHEPIDTQVRIGPRSQKPLLLAMPLFVSDMSFGSLSREAKLALAKGAELARTGICSGEGGMLPAEQEANSRYFYELASARFGFSWDKVKKAQAFHFKGGQGAKTGTGGHLPGHKVSAEIAQVRGLQPGEAAISPATFADLHTPADFRQLADQVRAETGGIPIGFKIAASHIEADIDFALEASADYIILDGRGGGTGAAPIILRNHINVPTIPALARARRHLNRLGVRDVTLVITGGLRVPSDFVKALALGADAIAVSNSALQAIGCLGMRACESNNCPVGIATQKENLRARLLVDQSAQQLKNFLEAATDLMTVVARACGHRRLSDFNPYDLATFHYEMHRLTGIAYAGVENNG